ncbi:respiratory nitrate reductase subunit gamma [Yinghuangia aomiensis]|uniref:Respiratory nitrate reductase subunit gamma n=1 Tax=Yinghuangia aomiensis TaxID=676205 RepID=A0ABP9IAW5_9ACTN
MRTFLWGALPYIAVALLVSGLVWRYRYDRFGWTTRSSESYESKILTIASPVFHYGILFVLVGHLMGLLVPKSWTDSLGVTEHAYHLLSLFAGTAAGALTLLGIAALIYRRRTNRAVFRATTRNDKLMYVVLAAAIAFGMIAKLAHSSISSGYNYRDTIAVWVRSLFYLQPKTELMADAPTLYQIHAVIGLVLFALIPFTRLVHMFSAPIQYVFRPYIVYRARDPRNVGVRAERRGWEKVGPR